MTAFGDHVIPHEFKVFGIEFPIAVEVQHHIRRRAFHHCDKETRGRHLAFNTKHIFSADDPGTPNFRIRRCAIGYGNNVEQVRNILAGASISSTGSRRGQQDNQAGEMVFVSAYTEGAGNGPTFCNGPGPVKLRRSAG